MGLSSVLVDQARVLRYVALQTQAADGTITRLRIEGETQMEWVAGPYFDCRIDSPAAPEAEDSAGGQIGRAHV